jgi:hypothetical protein
MNNNMYAPTLHRQLLFPLNIQELSTPLQRHLTLVEVDDAVLHPGIVLLQD